MNCIYYISLIVSCLIRYKNDANLLTIVSFLYIDRNMYLSSHKVDYEGSKINPIIQLNTACKIFK